MPKKITIELSDEDHKRFVNAKMDLRLKSLQELMTIGTAAYLDSASQAAPSKGVGVEPPVSSSPLTLANIPGTAPQDTLSPTEQEAVGLLLTILRRGSETVRKAIVWNLHGFAEPIQSQKAGAHGVTEVIEFPETVEHLIRSLEAISGDEDARRKWVADLKRLQTEPGSLRGKSKDPGKPHRKRSG